MKTFLYFFPVVASRDFIFYDSMTRQSDLHCHAATCLQVFLVVKFISFSDGEFKQRHTQRLKPHFQMISFNKKFNRRLATCMQA